MEAVMRFADNIDLDEGKGSVIHNSTRQRALITVQPHMDWILKQLGVESKDDVVWFHHGNLNALGTFLVKKGFFPDNPHITAKRPNKLANIVGQRIESCNICSGFDVCNLSFSSADTWKTECVNLLASISLKDLPVPLVFLELDVYIGYSVSLFEFMCRKQDLEAVITYFKQIEEDTKQASILHVDTDKFEDVAKVLWDDVIIDASIKRLIKDDFNSFMKKKEWFAKKHLPYRRGYLMHGPPGNGKTSVVKALLTEAKIPSFTMKKYFGSEAEEHFEEMFNKASQTENAIILLEDIDRIFATKVVEKDSSMAAVSFSTFLNCLDGVSNADGLIVIATANNPKNLDSAILERPGRFDRVVNFPNPNAELRKEYLHKLSPHLSENDLDDVLPKNADMSFAQLKEVYILAHQVAEEESREDITAQDLGTAIQRLNDMRVIKTKATGF
jgi:SpoVK/Ycf46/Vps4 family AAA+-type ATPase